MNLDLDSELNSGFFNGMRSVWVALGAAALLFALGGLSGCSQLMGGLRPDLNDEYRYEQEPTYGGRFTEGGLLDEGPSRNPNSEDYMGHRENQASAGRMGGQGTWLTQADEERPVARRSNGDEEGAPALAPRPVMQKKYKYGNRASRADFIDDSRGDGSLWNSDGQTNYLMTKNTVKSDGDLVTIVSDEEILKDISAELKRVMSPEERENELDVAQERARRRANGLPEDPNAPADGKAGDQVASNQSAASRSPASLDGDKKQVDVPAVAWGDVDLRSSMQMKAGDPIMAEVMERYPNGNYKLRGLKRIRMHGQTKMVSVVAIARHADITADETIPAGKLYEYRIEAVR